MRNTAKMITAGAERGLSDYWRRNTSAREAVELANVLRALRKVAGHLGQNAGTIEYAGMSRSTASPILVDPGSVTGRYPVPSGKVDILVGEVAHEAMHRIEWSDHVWSLLESDFTRMGPMELIRFQKIVSAGEDIYVDAKLENPILSLYLKKARGKSMAATFRSLVGKGASFDALMALWWADVWGEGISCPIDRKPFEACLGMLAPFTRELLEVCRMSGLLRRCNARAKIYRETAGVLAGASCDLPVIHKRLVWAGGSSPPDSKEEKSPPASEEKGHGLAYDLLHEIEHHLAAGSTDLTPLIRSVVGYHRDDVIPTSRWDAMITAHPLIDPALVRRLRSLFHQYARRESIYSRGLHGGRVDGRRLYRSATTGRCFKQREIRPDLSWNVTLLIDASGSMRGLKWRIVENTMAALHRALTGYGGRLEAYAYSESGGICMISSLLEEGRLSSAIPTGQTASGQALIAASLMMPARGRRKLLVHITDGESNVGCDVSCGIECCGRRHITLVTLGCGCRDRGEMQRQYGSTIAFLDSFRQLPQALENLLRHSFLHATAGSCRQSSVRAAHKTMCMKEDR